MQTVLRFLEEQKTVFRDRIFSPIVTLSAFIAQVLSEDHSCAWAVVQVNVERAAQRKQPCSPETKVGGLVLVSTLLDPK